MPADPLKSPDPGAARPEPPARNPEASVRTPGAPMKTPGAPTKDIETYRSKRRFDRTPEPPPGPTPPVPDPSPSFVVHRHEARQLHYDLRLEIGGVLKSWAVPRGFGYDPEVKKLAVHTEDHPLAYLDFHGVIPAGEYGGGTMVIWDRGRYEITEGGGEGGAAGVAAGKLVVRLRGRKLRGAWHLVKTKRGADEWLLFKGRDRYARAESERQPFFELAEAVPWSGEPPPIPVRPAREVRPFTDRGFLFEPEMEGLPVFLERAGGSVRLRPAETEPALPGSPEIPGALDAALPELVVEADSLRAEEFLAYGVLVATDAAERPAAARLTARLGGDDSIPVSLYLFDLLRYDEWDLRCAPLLERKQLLRSLMVQSARLLYGEHVSVRGEEFHAACEAAGLSGSLGRRADSPYPGVSPPSGVAPPSSPGSSQASGGIPDCVRIPREAPGAPAADDHVLAGLSRRRAEREAARPIRLTNLDKVFWPEPGYTKGDLIRYYDRVAEHLLPYLHERPAHMLRMPDGVGGKAFYQKDLPEHTPDWIETEEIRSGSRGETIRFLIVNDPSALLFAANLGSIDIHPWLSIRGRLDRPDWALFDLDPGGGPFSEVVRLARAFGKVLRGIGLRPLVKTSGASGLHIQVPLEPIYPYEVVRQFCEAVSTHIAAEHPEIATVERTVSRRGGKVYLDYLQNRRGQTVVPAYSARPVPAASVSAPLDWDELNGDLSPGQFTIRTMPDRLDRLGDLFAGALHDRQPLLPAIEKFSARYLAR